MYGRFFQIFHILNLLCAFHLAKTKSTIHDIQQNLRLRINIENRITNVDFRLVYKVFVMQVSTTFILFFILIILKVTSFGVIKIANYHLLQQYSVTLIIGTADILISAQLSNFAIVSLFVFLTFIKFLLSDIIFHKSRGKNFT